jgi:hypothetical protein
MRADVLEEVPVIDEAGRTEGFIDEATIAQAHLLRLASRVAAAGPLSGGFSKGLERVPVQLRSCQRLHPRESASCGQSRLVGSRVGQGGEDIRDAQDACLDRDHFSTQPARISRAVRALVV